MMGKLAIFGFAAWAGLQHGGVVAGLAMAGVVLAATSTSATLMQARAVGAHVWARAFVCMFGRVNKHTQTHAHTQTPTPTDTHTNARTHTHTPLHTHACVDVHVWVSVCRHVIMCTCTCASVCACARKCVRPGCSRATRFLCPHGSTGSLSVFRPAKWFVAGAPLLSVSGFSPIEWG